ncbi:MAG: helicase-related protein [Promethearchaeota archaeon]
MKNKKARAPWWNGTVKIIDIRNEGEDILIQGVYLSNNEFFEQIIRNERLNEIEFLEENDFKGNPIYFFLVLFGKLIRINYEYNPFFAVGISKIDPLPHQLEAVYKYIIPRPIIRFLIADDPGAGKTIMAGLVIKELKYRKIINRILIVSPGHLIDNWMREMKEKFSENFTHINRNYLNNYWNQNVWTRDSQIISSIDFLKQDDILEMIKNEKWDLVVVDEAHKMSAYQAGSKIKKTQRYKVGELLSKNTMHYLFLTATPHRGDMNNFTLFLSLLEPQMFSPSKEFNLETQLNDLSNKENAILIRRLKENLINFNGSKIFPNRYPKTIKYILSPEEEELYKEVSNYVKVNYNKALKQNRKTVAFALIILQRRLSSSVRAIKKSLIRRRDRLIKIKESDYVKKFDINELIDIENKYRKILESDEFEDLTEKERWRIERDLEVLTMAQNMEELEFEINELEKLITIAEKIEEGEEETKLKNLWEALQYEIRDKREKLIIFTEFRDTLEYLQEKIEAWGFDVEIIHGQMGMKERIRAEDRFRNEKQILIATEAAGEGINLQFCWLMVNYDLPWNPNRLEQRMGRIHRYLQTHDCYIYNLIAENTMEGKVFKRILEKLNVIRESLGTDRVFDVIGEIFTDLSLNQLIKVALSTPNGWEEVFERMDQLDQQLITQANSIIASESLAQHHLDLSILNEEIRKSEEFRLWPEYIKEYTEIALKSFGGDISPTGIYKIHNKILSLWNFDLEIAHGPISERYNNITFDKNELKRDSKKMYVAPGHPLLESLIEGCFKYYSDHLTRGAIFSDPDNRKFGLIWFFNAKITDGNNNIVSEKIISMYQDINGSVQELSPLIIWDLLPVKDIENVLNPKIYSRVKELMGNKISIINQVNNILNRKFFEELRKKRVRNYQIKKRAIETNMNLKISESIAKIYQYQEKIDAGENYELALNKEKKNKEKLIYEKNLKLEEINREKEITLNVPQTLGVIIVIPKDILDGIKKFGEDDELLYKEGIDKNKVDIAAMEAVIKYELKNERIPEDVHLSSCGYDILSKNTNTGEIRHIEVKGHSKTGDIFITPNEWFMAGRFGDNFWLYVVDNALNNPVIYPIKNPVQNLKYDKILETKRYIIKEESWKKK